MSKPQNQIDVAPRGYTARIVAAFRRTCDEIPPCSDHLMVYDAILRCERCSDKASKIVEREL